RTSISYCLIGMNSSDGVRLIGAADHNAIQSNVIGYYENAGNGGAGIAVEATARNNILSYNVIYGNGGLGIDLLNAQGNYGVTPNDPGDGDSGANDAQNFPAGKPGTSFTTLRVFNNGFAIDGGLD